MEGSDVQKNDGPDTDATILDDRNEVQDHDGQPYSRGDRVEDDHELRAESLASE